VHIIHRIREQLFFKKNLLACCGSLQCVRRMCIEGIGIQNASNHHIHSALAHIASNLTLSQRSSHCNEDLFEQALVLPELRLLQCDFAPQRLNQSLVNVIIDAITDSRFNLSGVQVNQGLFLNSMILFRGPRVLPKDVMAAVGYLKTLRQFRFFDWAVPGMRTYMESQPPAQLVDQNRHIPTHAMSVTHIGSSTSMEIILQNIRSALDPRMLATWTQRFEMEEEQVHGAMEQLSNIIDTYSQVQGADDGHAEY
jgi:hypothetical protein